MTDATGPAGRRARQRDSSEHSFWFTAVALLVGFVVAFLAGVEPVPAELKRRLAGHVVLWPQEWSFFTSLDQDVLVVYLIERERGATLLREHRVPDAWLDGFGRTRDEHLSEARQIAFQVPERYWQACGVLSAGRCEKTLDASLSYRMRNPSLHPRLCGPVAVAVERVAPPEPRHLPAGPRVVHRVAVADVRCTA
jgi:hypothetical protein